MRLSKFEFWMLSIVGECGLIWQIEGGKFLFADYTWEPNHKPISKHTVSRLYKNGYLRRVYVGSGLKPQYQTSLKHTSG